MDKLFQEYSGGLLILILTALVLGGLLALIPQLLRAQQRFLDLQHTERMRALDQGQPLPRTDDRSRAAGRTAVLVPSVTVITAGTVTCFLVVCRTDNLFAVTLTVWCVAGVISLAAVTGGVALMGRLAQIYDEQADEELAEHPAEK